MDAEKAIRLADSMRNDFAPRRAALDLCRRYGYQVRRNGDPAYQNDKNDVLSPLRTSLPASLAWRLAMYLHANTLGVGNVFFALVPEPRDPKFRISESDKNKVRDQTFKVIRRLFDTNFSAETNVAFNDVAVLGNNVTYCEYDEELDTFSFKAMPVGEGVYFGDNHRGVCDMFCRFYKYDAKQAFQEFGNAAGERVVRSVRAGENSSDTFEYLWIVYPRRVFGEKVYEGRGKYCPDKWKRYASLKIDVGERRIISESGYDDFPFAAPTWQKRGGSAYGYGPIEMSIPDIKDLLELKHLHRKAMKKLISPPIVCSSLWEGVSTDENAVTYVEGDVQNMFSVLPVPANVQPIDAETRDSIGNIRMNLMLDAFEALNETTKYMTTTEVNGRIGQSVRAIAPIVSRLHNQYFSPLIRRVFNIMLDRGEVELPQSVSPEEVSIRYVSVLDALVLQGESSKMQEFIGFVMNLIQARAGLGEEFDCYLDMESIMRHVASYYNVPTDVVRESALIREMLDALAQKRERMQNEQLQASLIKPIDMQQRAQPGAPMSAALTM